MSDEDAFFRAILDHPSLATPRLVYADWLDDQSDTFSARMAAFIRLEAHLSDTPERGLNHVRLVRQLRQLSAGLDPEWLALVSHPAPSLEACRFRFEFPCPARWDCLTPTADPRVRHCGSCDRPVHHCGTLKEARRRAAAGACVAVGPVLARRPGDLTIPVRPHRERPADPITLYRRRFGRGHGKDSWGRASPPLPDRPEPDLPDPESRPAVGGESDHRPKERRMRPDRRPRRSKRVRWDEAEE